VARKRVQQRLPAADRGRVKLVEANVLSVKTDPVDCLLATNFSYFIFKQRDLLRRYFEAAHRGLVDGGMLILDAYGGSDAFLEMEEPRECEGFTYVWDQNYYSPVTGHVINHIHFDFAKGAGWENR
jgi:hypothetical protein